MRFLYLFALTLLFCVVGGCSGNLGVGSRSDLYVAKNANKSNKAVAFYAIDSASKTEIYSALDGLRKTRLLLSGFSWGWPVFSYAPFFWPYYAPHVGLYSTFYGLGIFGPWYHGTYYPWDPFFVVGFPFYYSSPVYHQDASGLVDDRMGHVATESGSSAPETITSAERALGYSSPGQEMAVDVAQQEQILSHSDLLFADPDAGLWSQNVDTSAWSSLDERGGEFLYSSGGSVFAEEMVGGEFSGDNRADW